MSMDVKTERIDNVAEESESSLRFTEFVSVKVEAIKKEPGVQHESKWELRVTVKPELPEETMCVKEDPGEIETTAGPFAVKVAVKSLEYDSSRGTEVTSDTQDAASGDDIQDAYSSGVTYTHQRYDLCQQVHCQQALQTCPENIHKSIGTEEKPYSENPHPNISKSAPNAQKRGTKRPWPCDTCNKAYSRKDHLKTHQLSHSQENGSTSKPYTCDI